MFWAERSVHVEGKFMCRCEGREELEESGEAREPSVARKRGGSDEAR